jgi:hypothetical protein
MSSIIFSRQHEKLSKLSEKLKRIDAAYSGGDDYIKLALIKHAAEPQMEFDERLQRAYYVNHPRRIAQIISRFMFSVEPDRKGAAENIIQDWSRTGLRADEVMLQLCTIINCFPWGWLLVDMPGTVTGISEREKQSRKIRPYVRALKPFDVTDWSYGADGGLDWAIVAEFEIDKSNPLEPPKSTRRRRLWTRNEWVLYEQDNIINSTEIARASHNLGMVPLIQVSEPDGYGLNANHWFEDVVRISDAILNNESEAQMNIVKQMYGLLVVSEGFARSVKELEDDPKKQAEVFAAAIGRSAAAWEGPEEKGITRYESPNGAVTAEIRGEIKELKQELFDTVGLALQSNSKQAQTAESKAWDSHQVEQFLAARSLILEQAEAAAWRLINLWDKSIPVPDIAYQRDFAVADLQADIAALMDLSALETGPAFARAVRKAALNKLDEIDRISPKEYKEIENEIAEWEPQPLTFPGMTLPITNQETMNNED